MSCTQCGHPLGHGVKFCSECGTATTPAATPPTAPVAPAAGPPPPINFDARTPPAPGDPVPQDCVWAEHPYPGPVRAKAKGSAPQRIVAMGVVTGRPVQEIVAFAGAPSESMDLVNGDRVLVWEGRNFWTSAYLQIALLFDRYGVCRCVADQQEQSWGGGIGVGAGIGF